MAKERKDTAEMVGEFFREAGLLLLVFGYIDIIRKAGPTEGAPFWAVCLAVAVGGITLVSIGISIERKRRL